MGDTDKTIPYLSDIAGEIYFALKKENTRYRMKDKMATIYHIFSVFDLIEYGCIASPIIP